MVGVLRFVLVVTVTLGALACAHKRPYAVGAGPKQEDLLARTLPQINAVQVAEAKVILNRSLRGDLAFIAQAPGRFRGGVMFAGNELVTLAFHEEGYALRYKLDAFPPGYYEGPPDPCAVEALLGITIATDSLVSLVLGGAPLISAPLEVVDQRWSRKHGWEALTVRNSQYVQELRFGFIDGVWLFVGGKLWLRDGDGKGTRLWTVEHKSLERDGTVYMPKRTKVSTPGNRRDDDLVTIVYKQRNLDPAFAQTTTDGDDGGDDGVWDDDGGDDGWEDEGGDDGWEDEGAPAAPEPTDDPVPAEPAPTGGGVGWEDGGGGAQLPAMHRAPVAPEPANPKPPAKRAAPKIPEVFRLVPGTLVDRGDLCRR